MDSKRMSTAAIKEGISKGFYEITGVLPTGEIVISLLSIMEKEYLDKVLNSSISKKKKMLHIKAFIKFKNRPAYELIQVYKQNTCTLPERHYKNGLRLR